MEYRISFKDKKNELKGPFTERQVQEWYRKGWFDSSFPFFFTRCDESSSDEKGSGITLDSLRSLNGIGCPFFKPDERETSELEQKSSDRLECLALIEKEITELHEQIDAVLSLKKTIEMAEREVQKLPLLQPGGTPKTEDASADLLTREKPPVEATETASSDVKKKKKNKTQKVQKYVKPESITDDIWQKFYKLGNSVADLIVDAFDVYATGRFAGWEKNRVTNIQSSIGQVVGDSREGLNLVCEHILVEKMKEKELFCCLLCDELFYNYKQALIHFTSGDHRKMETAAVRKSGIDDVRRVLDSFTKLPKTLFESDTKVEADRIRRNGRVDYDHQYRPTQHIMTTVNVKYYNEVAEKFANCTVADVNRSSNSMVTNAVVAIEVAKGEVGRALMAAVNEDLGQGETACIYCGCITGDREGFYAHLISSSHLRTVSNQLKAMALALAEASIPFNEDPGRMDNLTFLVNVLRKDLV